MNSATLVCEDVLQSQLEHKTKGKQNLMVVLTEC